MILMKNRNVLNYTLLQLLGKGGMAEVWYAENEIGNVSAVKILNADLSLNESIVERFRNEARVTVKLKHPNIRQVYDYAVLDGRPCMVMEYLEGEDLSSRMKHGERFTGEQLKKWWNQLASALNYTHAQGIVHRDIKPSNIFIDRENNVKLLDFGIAKVQEGITMTQTGDSMGTLMYMSPEQVRDSKHIDHKTDLYSLAVTFVHLLTGNVPYDRDTTDDYEIRKNIVETPLVMTGVPSQWQNFLHPYLAKNPAERPALTEFSVEAGSSGYVPPVAPPVPASEETVVGGVMSSSEETIVGNAKTPQVNVNQKNVKTSAPQKPKKKRKGLIIGIVVAVLLLGAIYIFCNSFHVFGFVPMWVLAGVVVLVGTMVWLNKKKVPVDQTMEYVDLGLPSGTLWRGMNEGGDHFYSYDEAMSIYGNQLPTTEQWVELVESCTWKWTDGGYNVKGPNGHCIFLPTAGVRIYNGNDGEYVVGSGGNYWSSTPYGSEYAWALGFNSGGHGVYSHDRCDGLSVRLVQGK